MPTYRICVGSRDRKSGSATNFEYALPFSLAIAEKSLANIDVVVLHNSIKTVTTGKNDMIYIREEDNLDYVRYRTPRIVEGTTTLRRSVSPSKTLSTTRPSIYLRTTKWRTTNAWLDSSSAIRAYASVIASQSIPKGTSSFRMCPPSQR